MKGSLSIVFLSFVAFAIVPSIPKIRTWLAAPLIVSNEGAAGDACYVLAAGNAIWERLAAASDLYHMKRVPKIILMKNENRGAYNFTAQASWTPTQWELAYLASRGVPRDNIVLVEEAKGLFGTFAEAGNIARVLPPDVRRLVLVTSPPHMRRSLLAFRRMLPKNVTVIPFSATSFITSVEIYDPIWLEYLKLFVYAVFLFQ